MAFTEWHIKSITILDLVKDKVETRAPHVDAK